LLKYKGSFCDDFFEGIGKLYYNVDEAVKFSGEFKRGFRDGNGKELYPNGQIKFIGMLRDDEYEGKGAFYNDAGKIEKEGHFRHGRYLGKVKFLCCFW
jgi:antitoxin component YwqK of YwqJK toxin-antitoxin module